MALLIIGGTGTLGRQIIRKALNEGFQVKCLVRNFRRAAFLKEWGAELIYGDLILPETIPLALIGVTAVIDCSTGRPDDTSSLELVDLNSKYILMESAVKANIKRFIFFSISGASIYRDIKLVMLKVMVESRMKALNLNFTIFCIPGFFQGLVPQYALPILDKKFVWITKESSAISYINTQDASNIVIRSLSVDQFRNKYLPINGIRSWKSLEIIDLCERISSRRANINQVPVYVLSLVQKFAKIFQWTRNIADRLSFTEILSRGYNNNVNMKEVLYILRLNKENIEPLEFYLQEYFERITKKVRELNYQVLSREAKSDDFNF